MSKNEKGKRNKKRRKGDGAGDLEPVPWEEVRGDVDAASVAAFRRLISAEMRLHELWEQRSQGEMDWIGELFTGETAADEDPFLWLAKLGDRVAALGGQLELVAAFPDESVTLLLEPGLLGAIKADEP